MVVRGVPKGLAKDGWWLDDEVPPKGVRAFPLLVGVLFLADWFFFGVSGGLGFALWTLIAALGIYATVYRTVTWRQARRPVAILIAGVIPMIEVVSFVTVMIGLAGLITFGLMITAKDSKTFPLLKALLRLLPLGLRQIFQDALAMRMTVPDKRGMRSIMFDWALPVGVGFVFILLFALANPLLDTWFEALFDLHILPNPERFWFWVLMAFAIWPLLRLAAMSQSLLMEKPKEGPVWRSGFVNARSVQRALIVFNIIFLIQTLSDIGYLWGGFALPEGLSYAEYAHRGAYPLLVTALLAGMFAILAQPYIGTGSRLRGLLFLWIGQNIMLVLSSILRLELYVDIYGLTRLRVAAYIWMTVVAIGLGLMIAQMIRKEPVMWFFKHAFAVGFVAFYGAVLWNTDGYIARHNLAQGREDFYLCTLSEGAFAAMQAHAEKTGRHYCSDRYRTVTVSQPADWREWGYRNARMRNSVAGKEATQ